ncbi:S-adenosyl-L-methionine-dependent methyltransferase [Lojkania enalia]|uniref:S-adenosyl-L-methionine-dependent methyltransferase n=1 Tax=Lojkania enalia TaxID=147567 RepID=A0A9P4JY37_9PLEO|nr:S-adenosyl-L-methionine-dependent methyltransferase [Didymosphaeria enalia]
MTQPNTVDMTFDTSLVDLGPNNSRNDCPPTLNASFSTTESDPSDIGLPASSSTQATQHSQETPTLKGTPFPSPKASTPVQHLPTQDAYDAWASVYDTDGNMLQSTDDLELETLLPELVSVVLQSTSQRTLNLLDLGCGTGRNTAKLLRYPWPQGLAINITALDFSKGMLEIAATKLTPLLTIPNLRLRLEQCDCFPTNSNPTASPFPAVNDLHPVNALISTLVLEHVTLPSYFATLSTLVAPGGYALVTNMHSEMGRISQAGFINEQGVKVRGTSFAHTPEETVEQALKAGFEVVQVKERAMEKEDVESGRVGARGLKWVGVNVWYGVLLQKLQ